MNLPYPAILNKDDYDVVLLQESASSSAQNRIKKVCLVFMVNAIPINDLELSHFNWQEDDLHLFNLHGELFFTFKSAKHKIKNNPISMIFMGLLPESNAIVIDCECIDKSTYTAKMN